MTIAVDLGRKANKQNKQKNLSRWGDNNKFGSLPSIIVIQMHATCQTMCMLTCSFLHANFTEGIKIVEACEKKANGDFFKRHNLNQTYPESNRMGYLRRFFWVPTTYVLIDK